MPERNIANYILMSQCYNNNTILLRTIPHKQQGHPKNGCPQFLYKIFGYKLLEVFYAAFKNLLVFCKRNIFVKVFALSLAVSHFAENSAVR